MKEIDIATSAHRPTLLIVDDMRTNQEALAALFSQDYQVKVASNGIRALDIALRSPSPDLILLDVNMPEMDGYEVCRRLQENPQTSDIPVIFVTAASDHESEAYGLQLGAVDYIVKPIKPAIALLRVRNQLLLRQSLNKLRLASIVFENTSECIMITDAQNNIVDINPAFTQITGYSREEVMGKNPRIFKSGHHSLAFYQAMWQELMNNGHWQGEIWDRRKNGELHAKFLSINTIFNHEGQVHRYLALFSDITERKHYEEEIRRLSDSELYKAKLEAEKANRAKSEFIASMSHELRTPMNAVLGFAQLLEFEDLTVEQHADVADILTAGHHLLDLINEVLDLAKIESETLELNLEPVDLYELVQKCVTLVQPLTVKHEISLFNQITAANCFTVIVDSLRLKQILLNLLSNAVKYNQTGGRITLSCEVINPHILRVNVADTGKGLSETELAKLFQAFERLSAKNSNVEGTGIGLCISKKLIESMNGAIGVSSIVGKGSCFWIDIPYV